MKAVKFLNKVKGDITMNVLIIAGIDGTSGVDNIEMLNKAANTEGYLTACKNMMNDVNAAVEGFLDGGAETVYVLDEENHFIDGALDKRAVLLNNNSWEQVVKEGKIDAFAEVCTHAKAGTEKAFSDRTKDELRWFDFSINGYICGEMFIHAAFMGKYDIPLVMVSGDNAACIEATSVFGDVATAPVKRAVGRNTAISVSPEEAKRLIYDAAKRGATIKNEITPISVHTPAEIVLTYTRADYCELALPNRKLERLDVRTLRKYINSFDSCKDFTDMF